ncbi:MAG: hypothetical protein KBE09_00195 [Candidatus Pacebacteria bacterium]|nr:hypothetical protein [Candidatus Paceibacterota bacterium]
MKRFLTLLAITAILPIAAHAQAGETELEIQIRAALQEDAAAQGYSDAELDELTAALAQNAAEQGISAEEVSGTYGFAPESFETEEEETLEATSADTASRNPFLIVGGVLLLGVLSWLLVRSKHSPVSEEVPTAPKAPSA